MVTKIDETKNWNKELEQKMELNEVVLVSNESFQSMALESAGDNKASR